MMNGGDVNNNKSVRMENKLVRGHVYGKISHYMELQCAGVVCRDLVGCKKGEIA